MHRINEVELDGKPREEILSRIPAYPGEPEMTAFESSFLCGLLREARPKKILEVGVAAGGTTAIVLQCMEDLGQEYVMHSVDVLDRYYCNVEKPCGFMAEDAKRALGTKSHQFHFGSPVVDFLDEIGGGIDFVLLDTTHALPGELMDFLVIYPYLSRNAVVCLHDVAFCQNHEWPYMHATGVLLSSVTADKIMNLVSAAGGSGSYPNIAAFRINERTGEDMLNIVLGLALRWVFLPSREELEHYRGMVRCFYDSSICHLFGEAVRMNVGSRRRRFVRRKLVLQFGDVWGYRKSASGAAGRESRLHLMGKGRIAFMQFRTWHRALCGFLRSRWQPWPLPSCRSSAEGI